MLSLVDAFEISAPIGWTPKVLIGALYLTSKEEYNLVVVKETKINNKNYFTLNNITSYFKLMVK